MSAFALLVLTMATSLKPRLQKLGLSFFTFFLATGFYQDYLNYLAIGSVMVLMTLTSFTEHKTRWVRVTCLNLAFILGFLLFRHAVPGFHNPKIWDSIKLSDRSAPFTMYLNFDRPLFAVVFLLLFGKRLTSQGDLRTLSFEVLMVSLPLISMVVGLALALGFVGYDPKFTSQYFLWAANNLFLVCVGEEVFFRGFVQRNLSCFLSKWVGGEWLGVLATSCFFGAMHFPGKLEYAVLATFSGIFYGTVFKRTKSIEAPVIVHFLLNSVHFLFFSYPYFEVVS